MKFFPMVENIYFLKNICVWVCVCVCERRGEDKQQWMRGEPLLVITTSKDVDVENNFKFAFLIQKKKKVKLPVRDRRILEGLNQKISRTSKIWKFCNSMYTRETSGIMLFNGKRFSAIAAWLLCYKPDIVVGIVWVKWVGGECLHGFRNSIFFLFLLLLFSSAFLLLSSKHSRTASPATVEIYCIFFLQPFQCRSVENI